MMSTSQATRRSIVHLINSLSIYRDSEQGSDTISPHKGAHCILVLKPLVCHDMNILVHWLEVTTAVTVYLVGVGICSVCSWRVDPIGPLDWNISDIVGNQ
jgi:hypothetical protein